MDFKLLTINSEFESAKELGFPTEVEIYKDEYPIVRWGNSYKMVEKGWDYVDFSKVVNPSNAIVLNCNKKKALQVLATVVNTPTLFEKLVPADKVVVYRNLEHSGGKGFKVMNGPFTVDYVYKYATEFIQTDYEYRVWFCGNKTIMAQRVTQKKERLAEKYKCRSLWPYRHYKVVPLSLHRDTIKAKNVIGLDCGAADVLYSGGKYYFLELNSAPTLDSNKVIAFYQENLPKLVTEKFG